MKPTYLSVTFSLGNHDPDILMALLGEWPFESFHEDKRSITGYIQDHDVTEDLMHFIASHEGKFFDEFQLEKVEDRNWNEVWESSFNPVAVEDIYFIRASFHPSEKNYRHVITISPKMAFGTGHHATTYMMLKAMSGIDFNGKRVLDFGCGTGILGIAAAMEGASHVTGVDIQSEAIENSIEHADMNEVSAVCDFFLGELDKVKFDVYDIILANISRNVILENIKTVASLLNTDGILLISGIMFDDVEIITEALMNQNLKVSSEMQKDQWVQMTCVKTN